VSGELEQREQRSLLLSAAVTLILAVAGVAAGLASGAKSIVFDGMYSMIDAGMTLGAFFVARLIASGGDRRFQYGYWHLEPMLGFINGSVLVFACVYAFVDALDTLLMGGRVIELGMGVAYAAASAIICIGFHIFVRLRSRGLNSTLLSLDARAWLFSGLLNAGILAAFALALALDGTEAEQAGRYVDPAILLLLALAMLPLPLRALVQAGREILQVAPRDLDARVRSVAAELAGRHGFVDFRSYVSRAGRAQFIEIGFVGPDRSTTTTFGQLDQIRAEISQALGGLDSGSWLTVHFTADRQWL